MQHYDIWSADLKSPSTAQQIDMDIDLIERVEEELPAHEQLLLQGYDSSDNDYSYQLSNFSSSNSVRSRQSKGKLQGQTYGILRVVKFWKSQSPQFYLS